MPQIFFSVFFRAQMAELVDALVSNTNDSFRAGSTPALGTRNFKKAFLTMLEGFFHEKWLDLSDTLTDTQLVLTRAQNIFRSLNH